MAKHFLEWVLVFWVWLGFFGVVVLGLFVGLDLGWFFFKKLWKNNFPIIENMYLKYFEVVFPVREPPHDFEFITFPKWKFNKGHW